MRKSLYDPACDWSGPRWFAARLLPLASRLCLGGRWAFWYTTPPFTSLMCPRVRASVEQVARSVRPVLGKEGRLALWTLQCGFTCAALMPWTQLRGGMRACTGMESERVESLFPVSSSEFRPPRDKPCANPARSVFPNSVEVEHSPHPVSVATRVRELEPTSRSFRAVRSVRQFPEMIQILGRSRRAAVPCAEERMKPG